MKVFKKNQLAILVIALMLITAGYLNYGTVYNKELAKDTGANLDNTIDLAELGDAELVNTNVIEENKDNSESTNETKEEPQSTINEENEAKIASTTDDYFTTSKLERNVMYSQIIERYQEIIASNSQSSDQKSIAQEEINRINNLQNAIMITENLLSSKGFTQSVIFVNGDSVSVIIGRSELKPEEIAQIQNIISRELSADVENIHISMK